MSKSPEERLNEIKREIWQISESYTNITNGKFYFELKSAQKEHCAFLHFRLNELIKELNELISGGIKINLVYRKIVNNLNSTLKTCLNKEYVNDFSNDKNLIEEVLKRSN